jgi:hypothetical protein
MSSASLDIKREQAKPLLDQAIHEFGATLADLAFEAKLLIHTYKTVRSGESITFDKATQIYSRHSVGEWWNAILVEDLSQQRGACSFYVGEQQGNKESITDRFQYTLNSQFRWLLVSGYEAYERFLKRLYAELGFCDHNLWRDKDFGNKTSVDIAALTREEFARIVSPLDGKALNPGDIWNRLGDCFSDIKKFENKKYIDLKDCKMTYRDVIKFIEALRHQIVHTQGRVNLEFFLKKRRTKKETPLSRKLKSFIARTWFRKGPDGWEIWLLNKSPILQDSCSQIEAPLLLLLNRLGSHASLLYGESIKSFGHAPFWQRDEPKKG